MATKTTDGLPVGIRVDEAGIEFNVNVGWEPENADVEICVEFPDYSGWSGERVGEKYITLSREDWEAIVAHVADSLGQKGRLPAAGETREPER